MNRYEKHVLYSPNAPRLLSYDACQVQFILNAELPRGVGECAAASIASAIARHIQRMTFVRHHDWNRRREEPLNCELTRRLHKHVWKKFNFNFQSWDAYNLTVGRYHY